MRDNELAANLLKKIRGTETDLSHEAPGIPIKKLAEAAINQALQKQLAGDQAITMAIIYQTEALTEAIDRLGEMLTNAGNMEICYRPRTPYTAQVIMSSGDCMTLTPDPNAPNPAKNEEGNLSVIHVLNQGQSHLAQPHDHTDLEAFFEWASTQQYPHKPMHMVTFHLTEAPDSSQAVAYTTAKRVKDNAPFIEENDNRAIRAIIDEEIEAFSKWVRGDIYQAEVRPLCPKCGHPQNGKPLSIEREIQGPVGKAIQSALDIARANLDDRDNDES